VKQLTGLGAGAECWDRRCFCYAKMPQDGVGSGRAGRGAQTRSVSRRRIQVFEMGMVVSAKGGATAIADDGRAGRDCELQGSGLPAWGSFLPNGRPSSVLEVVAAQAREAATMW